MMALAWPVPFTDLEQSWLSTRDLRHSRMKLPSDPRPSAPRISALQTCLFFLLRLFRPDPVCLLNGSWKSSPFSTGIQLFRLQQQMQHSVWLQPTIWSVWKELRTDWKPFLTLASQYGEMLLLVGHCLLLFLVSATQPFPDLKVHSVNDYPTESWKCIMHACLLPVRLSGNLPGQTLWSPQQCMEGERSDLETG